MMIIMNDDNNNDNDNDYGSTTIMVKIRRMIAI